MNEWLSHFAVEFTVASVFLWQLNKVYSDWQEDRKQASAERTALLLQLNAVETALTRLETAIEGLSKK